MAHLSSIYAIEQELENNPTSRELWASCMERRRGGKRASLPELECFKTKDVKQEQPIGSDFRADDRLPGPNSSFNGRQEEELSRRNEPSSSNRSRPFSGGMWPVPIDSYREYLGEPLGNFLRPVKHLRGEQDVCVVYRGQRDSRIRDSWPFSLPLSVLKPYYKNMGSHASTNSNRNDQRRDENTDYKRRRSDGRSRFSPDTERNMRNNTDDVRTELDYPHRSRSFRSETSQITLAEGAALAADPQMDDIQLTLKNVTIPINKRAGPKEELKTKTIPTLTLVSGTTTKYAGLKTSTMRRNGVLIFRYYFLQDYRTIQFPKQSSL